MSRCSATASKRAETFDTGTSSDSRHGFKYTPVTTHVFTAGDPYLDTDVVFGVKQSLISELVRHEPGTGPDGRRIETPYYTLAYDFTLAPADSPSR